MAKCGGRAGRRDTWREWAVSTAGTRASGKVVQVEELKTAFHGTPYHLCFLPPPEVLIRKKCDPRLPRRTLKDQNLGQVPSGGHKEKKRKQKTFFLAQLLERCKRDSKKSAINRLAETARTCRRGGEGARCGVWGAGCVVRGAGYGARSGVWRTGCGYEHGCW